MNTSKSLKKHRNKAWSIAFVVRSWLFKRIILNISWLTLNLIGLIAGAIFMSAYFPDWILIWYVVVLFYGVAYRVISIIIFDAIIGDGFDW